MSGFASRVFAISDFVEWDRNGQLDLNPRFQRRFVWSDNAMSYLMDTIVRDKPIPKIFLRQQINPTTMQAVREVVDGQQRLKTILLFLKDGFKIKKTHNERFGGFFYSQLADVDDAIQSAILNYEISVDFLVDMSDPEVLDVFSRLNSYAVVLNDQEKINATYFGAFKRLADELGHQYFEFWVANRILTENAVVRMGDVQLAADLLISMIEGIQGKSQIKPLYARYERDFPYDPEQLARQFKQTMADIGGIFGSSLAISHFHGYPLFYSLFNALYHMSFGLKGFAEPRQAVTEKDYPRFYANLSRIDDMISHRDEVPQDEEDDYRFVQDIRFITTEPYVRARRCKYILQALQRS